MLCQTQFDALGTRVDIAIHITSDDLRDAATAAMTEARRCIEGLEHRLSRFREDSEVTAINRRAGEWVAVSPETAAVLRCAIQAFEATGGLVHPALGQHLEAAGYNRPWPWPAADPAPGDSATVDTANRLQTCALPLADNPVELSPDGRAARVRPGFSVDLGGIAKGWIVDRAAGLCRRAGFSDFVVNAGGDLVCAGRNGSRPWRIGVTDPWDESRELLVLEVESLAVATSGTYRRRWRVGREMRHHLIDPRTGRPAISDVVSCTVIGPDLVRLEWTAKAALLLGSEAGVEMLRNARLNGWVMVTERREVIHSWSC